MYTRLNQVGGYHRGRAPDGARRVHSKNWLSGGAKRIGQPQLWHHHALEHVGGGADHDRVDVFPRHVRVLKRAERRVADQPGNREVPPALPVFRLANADDRTVFSHYSPSKTATRFC